MNAWLALRPYAIGLTLLACYCVTSEMDYRVQAAEQAEVEARIQDHCATRGKLATQDRDGQWACTDSAPVWAMASPLQPTQGEQK